MHQVNINLLHPIYVISGSSASIFTIPGVMYEGLEEIVSRRRVTVVIYLSKYMGLDLLGREPLIEVSF